MTDILMQLFWQSAHAEQHIQRSWHNHAKRPSVDFDKGQVAFHPSPFFSFYSSHPKASKKLFDCYQLNLLNFINSYTPMIT